MEKSKYKTSVVLQKVLSARFGSSFNNFSRTFVWQARLEQNSKKESILPNKCARKVVEELNKSRYFQFADSTFCKATDESGVLGRSSEASGRSSEGGQRFSEGIARCAEQNRCAASDVLHRATEKLHRAQHDKLRYTWENLEIAHLRPQRTWN